MKKNFIIILALLMFSPFCSAQEQREIRIRVSDFPPQYFKRQGKWTGLDVELCRALVEKAGFKAKFVILPWSRALKELEMGGDIDLMAVLSMTEERSEFLHWIGPQRSENMGLVVTKKNINLPINTIEDLITISIEKKKKFGYQQNVFYTKELNELIKKYPKNFESISRAELNLRKTKADRILGFFEEMVTMRYKIKNNPQYEGLSIHPFVLKGAKVFFGVSKKFPIKDYEKLLVAYEELTKAGDLDTIRNQEW